MPIIAIAGGPSSGKSMLAQYIEKRLQDLNLEVSVLKNSAKSFFESSFKKGIYNRLDLDQVELMEKQYKAEQSLQNKRFHVITTPLFCNYCTALIDEFKGSKELIQKAIPEYFQRSIQLARSYDLIIFLPFLYIPNGGLDEKREKRCFEISDVILGFLKDNKLNYYSSGDKKGEEKRHAILRCIKKTFDLPGNNQNNTTKRAVPHETMSKEFQEPEKKDPYLEEVWGDFNLTKTEERTSIKKWNKRK